MNCDNADMPLPNCMMMSVWRWNGDYWCDGDGVTIGTDVMGSMESKVMRLGWELSDGDGDKKLSPCSSPI